MSTLTIAIIIVFVFGYLLIALESLTRVNKAAIALLMFVACWTLFMIDPAAYINGCGPDIANQVSAVIEHHLGSTSTTLFFLMGAMTIVEVVDQNGGFNWVRGVMQTRSKRALLWRISIATFFLSAILDNLTTSIVMVMILRKLVEDRPTRIIYASMVIIAANSGGAFSPIGDVTTIMLWIKGCVSTTGIITGIFIPSAICMIVPALIIMFSLKGIISAPANSENIGSEKPLFRPAMRNVIFALGVGGLVFVPFFHNLTGLPPFMGVLLVLALLWIATELIIDAHHKDQEEYEKARISSIINLWKWPM